MSQKVVAEIINKALADGGFRRRLSSDPNAVLAGYDLTQDEVEAIRQSLEAGERRAGERSRPAHLPRSLAPGRTLSLVRACRPRVDGRHPGAHSAPGRRAAPDWRHPRAHSAPGRRAPPDGRHPRTHSAPRRMAAPDWRDPGTYPASRRRAAPDWRDPGTYPASGRRAAPDWRHTRAHSAPAPWS